jgi:hypothetical protein
MSAVLKGDSAQAAPANEAELREALAWETGRQAPDDKSTWEWLWEAIQGDFNDNRSTGQIAFDAAVSMIPVVDQICDVRDIIANCRAIAQSEEKADNTWKWVALVLTLIGLFPSLGSLVKGVLKIFFVFVRRYGGDKVLKAVDDAMTWVITFLRKKEVQDYLRRLKVDEVFKWLADQVRAVRGKVNTAQILAAFDKGIGVMNQLLRKVTWLPVVGDKARKTIELVEGVRRRADRCIGDALKPVQNILDVVARRLELEHLVHRSGILNASNIHFRGTLPEAQAISLMRKADPLPPWLSKGRPGKFAPLDPATRRADVKVAVGKGWPGLTDKNIESFHKLRADEIVGPAKLYRVVSPSSGAMGDCWVSEEVFHKITKASDPKTAWRKHLAVWPDWNANGQFVVYEVPKGEKLKVWRGEASSQVKGDSSKLDVNLEGGWEQVVFKPTKDNSAQWDTMRIYQRTGNSGELKPVAMTAAEYRALPPSKQHAYVAVREQINDPRIKGPYDTKWGTTDFDIQMQDAKIGLPALPGQVTSK